MAKFLLALITSLVALGTGVASGAQLTASWLDNSNGRATTRIERRLSTDTLYVAIADVPPGLSSYVDASVSRGTTYCYRAMAWDTEGASPYSEEVCATAQSEGYTVTVSKSGTGVGTVTSTPAGIDCGSACAGTFAAGALVTLTASPDAQSVFDGWSGGICSGTDPCAFVGNTSVTVTASFSALIRSLTYDLSVKKTGPGSVTSDPSGIDCGPDCSESYLPGTVVTLTAEPKGDATFIGWVGGGCWGSDLTCAVSMDAATSVSAAFRMMRR